MIELPKGGLFVALRVLIGELKKYEVEGDSMEPTLNGGDLIAVKKVSAAGVGDIVVMRHPYKTDSILIKRVGRVEKNGKLFLISDNVESGTDSRTFGAVSLEYMKGKAVAVLR